MCMVFAQRKACARVPTHRLHRQKRQARQSQTLSNTWALTIGLGDRLRVGLRVMWAERSMRTTRRCVNGLSHRSQVHMRARMSQKQRIRALDCDENSRDRPEIDPADVR